MPPEADGLTPGEHTVGDRCPGRPIRDTILVLLPGPQVRLFPLLRVPLEGTVQENVAKYGHGLLQVEACRVMSDESTVRPNSGKGTVRKQWRMSARPHTSGSDHGRFPPNLLLVHGPGCRQVGSMQVAAPVTNRFVDGMKPFGGGAGHDYEQSGGGTETVPIWECQDDCPVKLLDEMSPVRKSTKRTGKGKDRYGAFPGQDDVVMGHNDVGTASRYFPQFGSLEGALEWMQRLVSVPLRDPSERLP